MPFIIGAVCVILIVVSVLFALFATVNNLGIPVWYKKRPPKMPDCVLAVFAHPDDEIMAAGTLSKWKRMGAKVHLLYFTHGEDGPTGGLVPREGLATMRETELKASAEILGADSLTLLSYPDRYLNTVPIDTLKAELRKAIEAHRPDTVICFDRTIGLYGHTDHAYAGECAQAFLAENPSGVRYILQMTLCPKMISLAKRVSATFKERYRDENGLPPANLAVSICREGGRKKEVCLAHKTQHEVVGDVQPLVTKLPAFIYYRIFSREYYHVTKLPASHGKL